MKNLNQKDEGMSKPTVPKSIEDLVICSLIRSPFDGNVSKPDGSWFFQHCHLPSGDKPKPYWTDKDYTSNGRFVPESLLRDRFAFAGEVKLTKDDALAVCNLISWILDEGKPIDDNVPDARRLYMIQSKLSDAVEEPTE